MVLRTSADSGRTWTKARIVSPEHNDYHQLSEPAFRAKDGTIVVAVDDSERKMDMWYYIANVSMIRKQIQLKT